MFNNKPVPARGALSGFDVNDNLTNEQGIDHVTIATRYGRAVADAIFNAN